jgi:hypothetical protein
MWKFPTQRRDVFIPACILVFVMAEEHNSAFFVTLYQEKRVFAFIQSLVKEPGTYFNCRSRKLDKEDIQHPASKLIFKGVLEVENGTNTALTTLTTLDNLDGPAVCFPDIDPVFTPKTSTIASFHQPGDKGHHHMILRNRNQWSLVYQAMCVNKYAGGKRNNPTFQFASDE